MKDNEKKELKDEIPFKIGDIVLRKNELFEIVKIDYTLIPPSLDIKSLRDKRIINTEAHLLSKLSQKNLNQFHEETITAKNKKESQNN